MDLLRDVLLHGGRENGDVEYGAALQPLPGKLLVHPNRVGSGGGVVLTQAVRLCIHNAERRRVQLRQDQRVRHDDNGERGVGSEFHEFQHS